MKQIVILAHSSDAGAHRIASELGAEGVRVLRPEALTIARWSHRVDSRGRTTTRLSWSNDSLDSDSVGAVLNRIRYLPVPQFQSAGDKDRDYAGAEFEALVTSWLAGFGDAVVHPVRRHPWLVPNLPPQHWAARAAACGLPLCGAGNPARSRLSSRPASSVLVAGDRAAGALAAEFGKRCIAVARCLRLPLLEFLFIEGELVAVDAHPQLTESWACSATADLLRSLASRSAT